MVPQLLLDTPGGGNDRRAHDGVHGGRMSWFMLDINSLLARLAYSASLRAYSAWTPMDFSEDTVNPQSYGRCPPR